MADQSQPLAAQVWNSVNHGGRRAVLAALKVMESADDPDFDRLARLAASLLEARVGLVVLVDADRHGFKARHGAERADLPARLAFCDHLVASDDPVLVVPDAARDTRFGESAVAGWAVRFFAGAPIVVRGQRIGALCVVDPAPRPEGLAPAAAEQLAALAETASSLFALKDEARVRAETAAELIREEWRHALTLEAGKVGSWIWDIPSGELVTNDILRRMFGLESGRPAKVDDIYAAIVPDHADKVRAAVQASFEDGVDFAIEFRVRSGRWLMGRGRVYQRDARGQPLVMMGVNIDTTETREAADRTRLLLRELNHRVKNTLAMIQSLARQTLRQSASQEGFIDAFSGRLRTLSDAHALLSDRDWAGVGLVDVITTQLGPFLAEGERQLTLEGRDVHLSPDHALGIGLILHELASNARKFGALSRAGGRIALSWSEDHDADGEITLVWKESGGPEVTEPSRRGFGTRLIERSLDKVLGSRVELAFPADGVEARITFPRSLPPADQSSGGPASAPLRVNM